MMNQQARILLNKLLSCAVMGVVVAGCATYMSRPYVPNADLNVETVKKTMTRAEALKEIKGMVSDYVANQSFTNEDFSGKNVICVTRINNNEPITVGNPTDGISCQTEIVRLDERGFVYLVRGSLLVGNPFRMIGGRAYQFVDKYYPQYKGKTFVLTNSVSFADITRASATFYGESPYNACFYEGTNLAFYVGLNDSKEKYNRVFAAAEIIFTNVAHRAGQ